MSARMAPRQRLERMLEVLGVRELDTVTALLLEWVERRWIRAHDVEPSVVLGAPGLRLGVNTSSPFGRPDLATAMSSALLRVLGVEDARVHAAVEPWLADTRRELFVAFALERRLRAKLYLRAAPIDDALARVGERLLGAPVSLDRTHTLCVDYVDGRAIGGKRYRYCDPGELEARAPALASFLRARDVDPALVAAHTSERLDGSAAVVHAQVAGFASAVTEDLGVALARANGAAETPSLARWCAEVPLFTRVIGVPVEPVAHLDSRGDTVYLGMPHLLDELDTP
jgi:hypothetical protein